MHSVQFDANTGKALSGIVPSFGGDEPLPKPVASSMTWIGKLMEYVKVHDIKTYPVKVEGGRINVDI
jgi:nitrite reductase/ring-hydroxylating ferredoxin subunit